MRELAEKRLEDVRELEEPERAVWEREHGVVLQLPPGVHGIRNAITSKDGHDNYSETHVVVYTTGLVPSKEQLRDTASGAIRADIVKNAKGDIIWERSNWGDRNKNPDFAPFPTSNAVMIAEDAISTASAMEWLASDNARSSAEPANKSSEDIERAVEYAKLWNRLMDSQYGRVMSALERAWVEFAVHDDAHMFGKTNSPDIHKIALAVGGHDTITISQVSESEIEIHGKNGYITIKEADTDTPIINSEHANSVGKSNGGRKALYMVAFDWAHNNGKTIVSDNLTEINKVRRTANMLASAMRWGTTRHLRPGIGQGLSFNGTDSQNFEEMIRMESKNVFDAIMGIQGARWANGRFYAANGRPITDTILGIWREKPTRV